MYVLEANHNNNIHHLGKVKCGCESGLIKHIGIPLEQLTCMNFKSGGGLLSHYAVSRAIVLVLVSLYCYKW